MPKLLLKFEINLDESGTSVFRHHGPQFHRWLPDAEKYAIVLDNSGSNAILKVWFERRGFVDGGFIKYDRKRTEVDPTIMSKQAVLDAGNLLGLLQINGISKENLVPLMENKIGDKRYIALGKKVVKLIHPPVSNLLNTIRTHYGQYWVPELEEWDSRTRSLGSYCNSILHLEWSLDRGKTWTPFIPNERQQTVAVHIFKDRPFPEFPTREGWRELILSIKKGFKPSSAALLLARAHQLSDEGNLRQAIIEGVSALELALGEFIQQKLQNHESLVDGVQAFWNLPLPSQLIVVASSSGVIDLQDIELAMKAVDKRNKVIHEGLNPSDESKPAILGLFRTVAGLLQGPRFRFPEGNPGNATRPVEVWEQQERKLLAKRRTR